MKTRVRIGFAVSLLAMLAPGFAGAALAQQDAESRPLDRIVVTVNDDVITESDINRELAQVRAQLRQQNVRLPAENVLRRQVIERMILVRLQLQYAERAGVSTPDAVVDDAVASIAAQNNMNVGQLREALRREGQSFDTFREGIRNDITIRRVIEREIASRVSVSPDEVEGLVSNQDANSSGNVQYNVSHILVGIPESATDAVLAQSRDRARAAREALADGVRFERVAAEFSDSQDALEGGRLGWRSAGQLPELFLGALAQMKPGEVSDVLRSPNGFHIIRLNDRRGSDSVTVSEVHVRHILLKPKEFFDLEEAEARAREIRTRIEKGADFAAIAREQSDDPVSSSDGGDIGWINPNEAPPAFARMVSELDVGEVSEPVRTQDGVHIIQVLDRRERVLAGEELTRANARDQIQRRKVDERYDQWLRQLRDQAYIRWVAPEYAPPGAAG